MTGPKRGNSRRSGRGHHRPDGSINVTPFVDVLLILLVMFMAVAIGLTATQSDDEPESDDEPKSLVLISFCPNGDSGRKVNLVEKGEVLPLNKIIYNNEEIPPLLEAYSEGSFILVADVLNVPSDEPTPLDTIISAGYGQARPMHNDVLKDLNNKVRELVQCLPPVG